MFSSTIYRLIDGAFNIPPRFKQMFTFQSYRLFHHSFWDHSNLVCLRFRLLVYRWSPVYLALARRIIHWQMAWLKRLNEGMLILSNLELPALSYVAPITAISRLPEYQLYNSHEIVRWPCGKVICHSQKYTRDHWVMQREVLWLYTIILYNPIVLDTLFSEYY